MEIKGILAKNLEGKQFNVYIIKLLRVIIFVYMIRLGDGKMGIEFVNMDMEQLEDLLYGTSEQNDKDLSTFVQTLYDMYGGIDEDIFEKLLNFVKNDLRILSDAQIKRTSYENREKIIEYIMQL